MSENRSDYSLPRTDIHGMLPAVIQNPLLKAISESTFNRFLTKPELTRVIGTIGTPSPNSKNDQIAEQTVYDRAYQLQPAIFDNTSSTTEITTYADLKRIGERLGIDFEKVQQWQDTEQFNYCPPIDLDKLTNFRDYYWVGLDTPPQYITIASKYVKLQAELSQMVANYLITPIVTDKLALWPSIESHLNLIHTVVPESHRFVIPNVTVVTSDIRHPPYVPKTILTADMAAYAPKSDWARDNRWVHRNDVDDTSSAVVAVMPIIEYRDTLVLTGWTYTEHIWQYRASPAFPWMDVTVGPSREDMAASGQTKTSRGDDWLGFQQHWNYLGAKQPVPVIAQPTNKQAKAVAPLVAVAGEQIFVTTNTIHLGKNTLRVYVNRVRQYGTYEEVDEHTIRFYTGLQQNDVVELFTEVAADSDIGLESASPLGLNLVEYRLEEQYKHESQDYPQFDLVDSEGKSLHESSSIFAFSEDASYPVHSILGKRIVYNALKRDYSFDIGLVGQDKKLKFFLDTSVTPQVCSVWAKDTSGNKYVPQKVNSDRKVSSADDAVWEIPAPFMHNIHHEARGQLNFSELFIHFQSILQAQSLTVAEKKQYGASNANAIRLNSHLNLGLGGTIKEYNGNFANFASALISTDYSPLDVIDFAQAEYESKLIEVRKQVEFSLLDVLTNDVIDTQKDIVAAMTDRVLQTLAHDATQSKVYNDSTPSLQSAVNNWIATLPYIRMAEATVPYILRDDKLGIIKFVHHDGHIGSDELNTNSTIRAAIISTLTPSETAPTAILGKLWYKQSSDTLTRYNGNTWEIVDPLAIVLAVLLNIETALYETAPKGSMAYDIDALREARSSEFDDLLRIEYETYCKAHSILQPYKGDFKLTDPFTWNYSRVDVGGVDDNAGAPIGGQNRVIGVNVPDSPKLQAAWGARWEDIYQRYYGTSMPHLEPWKLTGYMAKPDWWDATYKGTTRRWTYEMWKNIIRGIVPSGKALPNGTISNGLSVAALRVPVTSVNIRDEAISGYGPDELLPPYWPYSTADGNAPDILNQCMLDIGLDYLAAKVSENEFPFGKRGPKEQAWRLSMGYNYAKLKIAFKLDPIRFLNATFGEQFSTVQGLQICKRTSSVLSHHDVVFHGDVDANGKVQYFDGLNQWYVQLFRNAALYGNGSSAQRIWTDWTTQLCYNVGGFMVDNTLTINSNRINISPTDYAVKMKAARKVRDLWIDALYVTITQAGSYAELPQGAGRDWKFNVGVRNPIIRDLKYYGVKKYRITADATTNTFTMIGGSLEAAGWTNGSSIMLDTGTNGMLPTAVDDVTYYSIIPVPGAMNVETGVSETTQFKIATNKDEAAALQAISLLSSGSGTFYVAELASTFYAFEARNTSTLWKHFAINYNDLCTFSSGVDLVGVQNMIDFVDGYVAYLTEQGFIFNDSSVPEYDEEDRLINWQYEIEATINYMYLQMGSLMTTSVNSIPFQLGEIEINPFRHNLWINHSTGVVSEFTNTQNSASHAYVYDRNGNKIATRDFHVLRQDNRTQFSTLSVENESVQTNMVTAAYDPSTNIAGIHMFFDEYEHVIAFNPRTISNDYLYDSFLGVSVPRVKAYFDKQTGTTKRPNVGGFVLQGDGLSQNYEYTVGNIQQYYDTFAVNENSDFIGHARSMLGYKPNASYFQGANITPKSQFLFYKGMIKAKGTLASVKAFTSSAQAASTEMDEFWAYKAYEFGDKRTKQSYTINLRVDDTAGNLLKFQFVPTPTSVGAADFTKVAVSDSSRWFNFPSQLPYLASVEKLFGMKPVRLLSSTAPYKDVTTGLMKSEPMIPDVPYAVFDAIDYTVDGEDEPRSFVVHGQSTGITVLLTNPLNTNITGVPRNSVPCRESSPIVQLGVFSYVPDADNIDVYVNGKKTTEFTEPSNNTISLNTPVTGVVVVVKKIGTLKEGVHYTRRNSRMIELTTAISISDIQILLHTADYSNCTPVKIYDMKSNAVVADVAPWDPASGYDNALLVQNVDTDSKAHKVGRTILFYEDRAQYNVTPDVTKVNVVAPWGKEEVGKVWKDTGSYEYAPYDEVTLSSNNQLADWGSLAEWSDPAVYQWVESDVTPINWDTTNGVPRKEVYERSRTMYEASSFDVETGIFDIADVELVAGDEVIVFGDELPKPLSEGTIYSVVSVNGVAVKLAYRDGSEIEYTEDGVGTIRITKAAYGNTWKKLSQMIEHREMLEVDFEEAFVPHLLPDHTEVTIYANGVYLQDGVTYYAGTSDGRIDLEPETIAPFKNDAHMYQLTILTKTGVVDGLPTTRPADVDLTDTTSQFYTSHPYTVVEHTTEQGEIPQPLYYFWVRGLVQGNSKQITMANAEYLISHNDGVYMTAMHAINIDGQKFLDKLVVSGAHGMVTDDDRYVLRMEKNSTMRDSVTNTAGEVLNGVHSQWIMFREGQPNNVAQALWNKVIEAIVGYSLDDPTTSVPALDRVIYDAQHSANTRFGLNKDQAFVDGKQALDTILAYLNSSTIEYNGVDIDAFLQRYNFSTKADIVTTMNAIYMTFPAKYVNMLFFAVLNDALSNHKVDYSKSLMKTSMISLSGTYALNVNGVQDE